MQRRSLAALLALTSVTTPWALAATSPGPVPPAADMELARDILRELVDINSTHDHGSTGVAQVIQHQLIAAGFSEEDIMFLAPADKPTKGNVIVRYRAKAKGGKKPLPAVLFLGHLDVVEARREEWSTDPFVLTEKDGFYYGRGTEDMKDGDAAML